MSAVAKDGSMWQDADSSDLADLMIGSACDPSLLTTQRLQVEEGGGRDLCQVFGELRAAGELFSDPSQLCRQSEMPLLTPSHFSSGRADFAWRTTRNT